MTINKVKLKKVLSHLVTGMAYSRNAWVDQARNRLAGALGEYAKLRLAKMVNFNYNWEPEVIRLAKKIGDLFDEAKTICKSSFDKKKAFIEAFREAASSQEQVVSAKNKFEQNYLKTKKDTDLLFKKYRENFDAFDSEKLLIDMMVEYLPKLASIITGKK